MIWYTKNIGDNKQNCNQKATKSLISFNKKIWSQVSDLYCPCNCVRNCKETLNWLRNDIKMTIICWKFYKWVLKQLLVEKHIKINSKSLKFQVFRCL